VGWKWIIAFGATLGIFYHAGHVQMWTYAILLIDFAVLLLLMAGAIGKREILALFSAHLLALAIASPLLVPQLAATRDVIRIPEAAGIGVGLGGLLVPDSLIRVPHPLGWGDYPIGEMYYTGTLFIVVSAFLLLSLMTVRWNRKAFIANVWFLCALLAFVLALGKQGLLWTGLGFIPGFDRFRWAYKFLGYLALFTSIGGAAALERLIRNRRWSLTPQVAILSLFSLYGCFL
jgi:hypothetical protein